MQLKSLAAAAALAVSSSAFAVNADLGTLGTASFGNFFSSATGAFLDTFTFELASATTISGSSAKSGIGPWAIVIEDSMGTDIASDATPGSFSFSLGAGSYTLNVIGLGVSAGGFYGGNVMAAAVPEPETYALMLAGLGMVGFMAARRSRG